MLLGENTLVLLVLALGAAMLVGNVLAIVRPPERPRKDGDLEKAPVTRSVVMIAIGAVACTWALVSLIVG